MKILLHTCCADCLLKIVEQLKKEGEVTIFYNNPNIQPRTEYLERLKAVQGVLSRMNEGLDDSQQVKIIVNDWKPKDYYEAIGDKREKPQRCMLCWNLRLTQVAQYAKAKGYDGFSSTLLSSHYQDHDAIVRIANGISEKLGIRFFVPENIDCDLKTGGFYKQNYCGCAFSLVERLEEKYP